MQTQKLIDISESLNRPSLSLSEIILIVKGRRTNKNFLEEPNFTVEFASEHIIYDHAIRCIHSSLLTATNEIATNKSGQIFTRYMVKPDDFLLWAMREQNKGGLTIINPDVGQALIELLDDKELKGIPNMIARELLQNDEHIKQMMIKFNNDKSSPLEGRIISKAIDELSELKDAIDCYMRKGKGKIENRHDNLIKAIKNALEKVANSREFNDLFAYRRP